MLKRHQMLQTILQKQPVRCLSLSVSIELFLDTFQLLAKRLWLHELVNTKKPRALKILNISLKYKLWLLQACAVNYLSCTVSHLFCPTPQGILRILGQVYRYIKFVKFNIFCSLNKEKVRNSFLRNNISARLILLSLKVCTSQKHPH